MPVVSVGIGAMVCLVTAACWIVYQLVTPLQTGVKDHTVIIQPGTRITQVAYQLEQRQIMPHSRWLRWFAILRGDDKRIQAGEYSIKPGMTPMQLLDDIVAGRVAQYAVRIAEGWRFEQLMNYLAKHPKVKSTLAELSAEAVMTVIDREGKAEGQFFPDTYFFPAGATDVQILQKAFDTMQAKVQMAFESGRASHRLKDPQAVLVLASIIEMETHLLDEKAQVSGVYHRRLNKNMRLQADPTVIYALGPNYQGMLLRKHLKINSPYNTYRHKGLPPTPIAIPSWSSIEAAANPADGDALYFVANGLGGHTFSVTLEQHIQASLNRTSR